MAPQLALLNINQSLDEIKKLEQDLEYWSARELMPYLGYVKWQKFEEVITRAKEACKGAISQSKTILPAPVKWSHHTL